MDALDIGERGNGASLLLRAREVKDMLGLSKSKIYELMKAGELPTVRVGRAVRVSRAGLEAWVRRQAVTAARD